MKRSIALASTVLGTAMLAMAATGPANADDQIGACLITKTDINPFFVKM
ncbi:hypothetical protein [Fodinicurvata sp. EGI_FJ10296]